MSAHGQFMTLDNNKPFSRIPPFQWGKRREEAALSEVWVATIALNSSFQATSGINVSRQRESSSIGHLAAFRSWLNNCLCSSCSRWGELVMKRATGHKLLLQPLFKCAAVVVGINLWLLWLLPQSVTVSCCRLNCWPTANCMHYFMGHKMCKLYSS